MSETEAIMGHGWMATPVGEEYDLTFDPGAHIPQELTVRIDQEVLDGLQAGRDFDSLVLPLMRAQGVMALGPRPGGVGTGSSWLRRLKQRVLGET